MFVLFDGSAPVTLYNLYLHGAIKSPSSPTEEITEGIGAYMEFTTLEYV